MTVERDQVEFDKQHERGAFKLGLGRIVMLHTLETRVSYVETKWTRFIGKIADVEQVYLVLTNACALELTSDLTSKVIFRTGNGTMAVPYRKIPLSNSLTVFPWNVITSIVTLDVWPDFR